MDTITADEPQREEKVVADLERGTWIQVVDDDGDVVGDGRVLHVEVYDDTDFGRRALLTYRLPGYAPETLRCDADMTMPLLTEDQIAAETDQERRELIATQLEAVAGIFRNEAVPLPRTTTPVAVSITYPEAADVEAVAEALDLAVKKTSVQVYAGRQVDGDSGAGVDFNACAYVKPDATGLDYSRADDGEDPQPAERRAPSHFQHGTDDGVDELPPPPAPTRVVHFSLRGGEGGDW